MAEKIRVGLVGARGSWATRAHLPALTLQPDYELKAVCTTREETARDAATSLGVELAFHDVDQLAAHPDVDLVTVSVRVPYHHQLVLAALRGGKHVYCEWPLGANTAEAEEVASLARERGVVTMVGLQGRADPSVNFLRDLIAEGYVGEVLSVTMTLMTPGVLSRPSDRTWQGDRSKGAHTLSIVHGHAIDILCYCLGEFSEVAARVATRVPVWRVTDTGGSFETNSPDNVMVCGLLQSGAVAAVHVAAIPYNGSGWRLEVYGREGTIIASSSQMAQMAEVRLLAAKGNEPLAELQVPDRYVIVPEGTPKGPPFNVGQMYARLADAIRKGGRADPDFDLAVTRHRLLDAIQRASDEGRTVLVE